MLCQTISLYIILLLLSTQRDVLYKNYQFIIYLPLIMTNFLGIKRLVVGVAPTPFQSLGFKLIDKHVYLYSFPVIMACYRDIINFVLANKWAYFLSIFFRISKQRDLQKLYFLPTRMINQITGVPQPIALQSLSQQPTNICNVRTRFMIVCIVQEYGQCVIFRNTTRVLHQNTAEGVTQQGPKVSGLTYKSRAEWKML